MEFKDYYKILGVEESADEKAIKTAYRKLARKYHPDVSEQHDAEDRFKEITEAYNVLKDNEKRAEYDELRKYGQAGGEFRPPPGWQGSGSSGGNEQVYEGDFSEFFEEIFGRGQRQARGHRAEQPFGFRGRDIELEMPIMLEESISGYSSTISYDLPHYDEYGHRVEDIRKNLKINIPAGIADGESVRLKGQGAPGIGDGPPGDLYLKVRLVPHPLYDIEGHNLLITVPLAPWEAALGAKVVVPTLDGEIKLTIPANSQSGKRMRIRGKGLVGKTGKGDLYAVLKIVLPDKITGADRELWKQMRDHSDFNPRANWR